MEVYKWPIYIEVVYLWQNGHHRVLIRVKYCIYNQCDPYCKVIFVFDIALLQDLQSQS
jgi:hypothetical protein